MQTWHARKDCIALPTSGAAFLQAAPRLRLTATNQGARQ